MCGHGESTVDGDGSDELRSVGVARRGSVVVGVGVSEKVGNRGDGRGWGERGRGRRWRGLSWRRRDTVHS